MATVITEECINCGACEPECPNTAIYQGGVEWELDGAKHAPISSSIFYIVPDKCTECVGFYDHEACAAVCPVDCCIPDPNRPETEDALLARAKKLHPEEDFPADFPSRFRQETPAAGAASPGGGNGAAAAKPAPKPATASPPSAAVAPAAAKAPPASGRVEKPTAPPPAKAAEPARPKAFPGELPEDFEDLLERLERSHDGRGGWLGRSALALLQPLLGALPHTTKQALEIAVGERRSFSNARATALNILLNMIVYPAVLIVVAWLGVGEEMFGAGMKWYIFLGAALAGVETAWRLREGVFQAKPMDQIRFGPALYGIALALVIAPWARRMLGKRQEIREVGFDGFYGGTFDDKLERDRRYGDVYRFEDWGAAYFLRLEFPRALPPTGLKDELGLPDRMPDYEYDLSLANGCFVVRGKMTDPRVKKLTAVAPAFPPEFTTQLALEAAVQGFKHRYREKVLEVLLVKKAA